MYEFILLEQLILLHAICSTLLPVQFWPYLLGAGSLHDLDLDCTPPTHVNEQELYSLHADHIPSSTIIISKPQS